MANTQRTQRFVARQEGQTYGVEDTARSNYAADAVYSLPPVYTSRTRASHLAARHNARHGQQARQHCTHQYLANRAELVGDIERSKFA